jgi:uncharacterized delta-60 repeat protein
VRLKTLSLSIAVATGASALVFVSLTGAAPAAPGALDTGFGAGGIVTTSIDYSDGATALAVPPDGNIIAAGTDSSNGSATLFALIRYTPDGTLDPSFGSSGIVTTPIGDYAEARAVAIQPDGKIVVAGSSRAPGDLAYHFAVVRYNADGSLDPSFGAGGIVTTAINVEDIAYALALQPDGKIVVAGSSYNGSQQVFAVVRYEHDGSPDAGFGSGGSVTTDIALWDQAYALALQPDGGIVAAGATDVVNDSRFALVRYTASGDLDTSFGTDGIVITPIAGADEVSALALQPDGKIVAAGQSSDSTAISIAVARYNPDGTLDPDFGSGGVVTTLIGASAWAFDVALQPDGKIVAAGAGGDTQVEFVVVRYRPDGTLDRGFASGGIVMTEIGERDEIYGAALQPDGKVDVAGKTFDGSVSHFALARYLGSTLAVTKTGDGSGTVTSTPSGIDCGTTCTGSFAAVPVELTPTAASGSIFAGWSGDCAGIGACNLQLTDDRSVTARFELLPDRNLTVTKAGTGAGTVASTPAGIDCGANCTHAFTHGTTVVLLASPGPGSSFAGWSGDCAGEGTCTLQLTSDRNVTATFESDKTITVSKSGSGAGTVNSSPAGIDCGTTCTHAFRHGTTVVLAARSVRGTRFAAWSGDCTGTGTCRVQLTENRNVTAVFDPLCVVPRLKGKNLAQAGRALTRAHCKLGTVRRAYAAGVKRGRVARQNPAPAAVRPRGAKVRITLSRGRKR